MTLDDDYDEFYTLPDDWFELEPTIQPEPNESSISTIIPTTPPSPEENKRKTPEKQESDEELLRRMQPLAAETKTHARSYRNLSEAQKAATNDPKRKEKYLSSEIRAEMKLKTQLCCDGKTPRWYQEDSGEAFMLGMDVVLVSATGSGKTLAFLQGLLADKTEQSKLIIISPLNLLEYDMVCVHHMYRDLRSYQCDPSPTWLYAYRWNVVIKWVFRLSQSTAICGRKTLHCIRYVSAGYKKIRDTHDTRVETP